MQGVHTTTPLRANAQVDKFLAITIQGFSRFAHGDPIRLKFNLTSGREFYLISGRTRALNLTSKPKIQGGFLWVTERQQKT